MLDWMWLVVWWEINSKETFFLKEIIVTNTCINVVIGKWVCTVFWILLNFPLIFFLFAGLSNLAWSSGVWNSHWRALHYPWEWWCSLGRTCIWAQSCISQTFHYGSQSRWYGGRSMIHWKKYFNQVLILWNNWCFWLFKWFSV